MTTNLEAKIRDVLLRLSLLAEGSTVNLEPMTSHDKPGTKVPPGVDLDGGPPRDDGNPAIFWQWQFTKALVDGESEFEMHRLVLLAERDWADRFYPESDRIAMRQGTLDDRDANDPGGAERNAADRVIQLYEGVPAVEVAVHERTTEKWVEKIRRMAGRNPQDGRPRPEFLSFNEKRRRATVHRLAEELQTREAVANRLGVDRETVKRYWPVAEEPGTVAA